MAERGIYEPPPTRDVHVIVPLPSGSEANFTFYTWTDAKSLYDAVAAHWKTLRLPPPRLVRYKEEVVE